jgi:hypothetical protein
MKTEHEQATLTLEANFTEKLIVEYNKYQALEACSNKMREEYERYDQHRATGCHISHVTEILTFWLHFALAVCSLPQQIATIYSLKPTYTA